MRSVGALEPALPAVEIGLVHEVEEAEHAHAGVALGERDRVAVVGRLVLLADQLQAWRLDAEVERRQRGQRRDLPTHLVEVELERLEQ